MYTYDLLNGSLLSVFLPKFLLHLLASFLIYKYHIRLILESCLDLPTVLVCHYLGVYMDAVSSPACVSPVASWNMCKCPFVGLGVWGTTQWQNQCNCPLQEEPQSLPREPRQVRYLQRRTETRQHIA